MRTFRKNPTPTRVDFRVDWAAPEEEGGPWLPEGDTISTSSFDVPDGLEEDGTGRTTTTTTVWLKGGTLGETYEVTNHITTTGGRIDQRTFAVKIENR